MAVLPKHTDQNPRYNPDDDMTLDQLQRFTRAANNAQQKRQEQREHDAPSIVEVARRARRAAMRPVIKAKENKPNAARYAIWLVVFAITCLWIMYMSG
ncbi:hypothetical protein [Vibrio furnissii]|uniref:hypothetical protein n=1 Tax=Vibrio furnissii TaxID=29494 RepID=UPI001E48919E|nr:hypothetical protein [Vibrio furnissii]UHJ62929.1 hypothetical protein LUM42_18160 [Vibrio furnissii]